MRRNLLIILVGVLCIVSSVTAFYFYSEWKKAVTVPSAEEEIGEVVAVVGEYMELPQEEVPTIATVIDKEKLQDQPFFSRAENGDKVLIYTNARKAILYRPTTKKVIEVAPIFFDEGENSAAAQTPEVQTPPPTPQPVETSEVTPTAPEAQP